MIAQQLADVSLELARMQYQYAVVVSYVVYTILAVTAVIIFYALVESRPEEKKEDCVAIAMITSESAHRRKAHAEIEANIGSLRTMMVGHKALNEKALSDLEEKLFKDVFDTIISSQDRLQKDINDTMKYVDRKLMDIQSKATEMIEKQGDKLTDYILKADRNFKVLDKRTKKKPRLKQQQIDKIKEVGKQVTDFDSLEVTEEDKERAFNWMISDRINNR